MLVEAKFVVKYTENDGWGYDTWERGFETEEEAHSEIYDCNRNAHCIRAEYLGLKIIGQYDT